MGQFRPVEHVAPTAAAAGDAASAATAPAAVSVRSMRAEDEAAAQALIVSAFRDRLGLAPDAPFWMVHTNWAARRRYLQVSLIAEAPDGEILGCILAGVWGTAGFFGPLAVDPARQGKGVAKALLSETMRLLREVHGAEHIEIFTFAESAKHHMLYLRSCGLRQGFLSYIMIKSVPAPLEQQEAAPAATSSYTTLRLRDLQTPARADTLARVRALCGRAALPGLDIGIELSAVEDLNFGAALLIYRRPEEPVGADGAGQEADEGELVAVAAVHSGAAADSEAPLGAAYCKIAVAADAAAFGELLAALEGYARSEGCQDLQAGISLARTSAYDAMSAAGFKISGIGVLMSSPPPGEAAAGATYNRRDVFMISDMR